MSSSNTVQYNTIQTNQKISLDTLQAQNISQNNRAIFDECDFDEMKQKCTVNLNSIASTKYRRVRVLNKGDYRNGKEVFKQEMKNLFHNIKVFFVIIDSNPAKAIYNIDNAIGTFYTNVRKNISDEMYQKIAMHEPDFFDNKIEILRTYADELAEKAGLRTDLNDGIRDSMQITVKNIRSICDYIQGKVSNAAKAIEKTFNRQIQQAKDSNNQAETQLLERQKEEFLDRQPEVYI